MCVCVCINMVVVVVATNVIIIIYHQTNDEYLTGSFNKRNVVNHKKVPFHSFSFFSQLLDTFYRLLLSSR